MTGAFRVACGFWAVCVCLCVCWWAHVWQDVFVVSVAALRWEWFSVVADSYRSCERSRRVHITHTRHTHVQCCNEGLFSFYRSIWRLISLIIVRLMKRWWCWWCPQHQDDVIRGLILSNQSGLDWMFVHPQLLRPIPAMCLTSGCFYPTIVLPVEQMMLTQKMGLEHVMDKNLK